MFMKPWSGTFRTVKTSSSLSSGIWFDVAIPDDTEDVLTIGCICLWTWDRISYEASCGVSVPFMIKTLVPCIPVLKLLKVGPCKFGCGSFFQCHAVYFKTIYLEGDFIEIF